MQCYFYLRPLACFNADGIGFSCQPLGIHKIENAVKDLCLQAGISGRHSNHSLRATSASRLYDAGIDEQLIQERTGHRSNAVRGYKRTSSKLQKKVTDTLCGGARVTPPVSQDLQCVSSVSQQTQNMPSVSCDLPSQPDTPHVMPDHLGLLRDTPEGKSLEAALKDSNLSLSEALCTRVCDLPSGLFSTIRSFMLKFAGKLTTQTNSDGINFNVHVHFH